MRERLGRRGAILLVLAVIDFAYGISLIGPSSEAVSSASTIWREHFAPTWAWGSAWLVVGAVLTVSAFMKHDAIGYSAAIGWKIMWSLTSLLSWMFGGVDRGWIVAIIFGAFGGLVVVDAGRAEVTTPPSRQDEDDG